MAEFAKKFWSPYEDFKKFNGMSFIVLKQINKNAYDYKEVGDMWLIRLENGQEIQALPEEILASDQKRLIEIQGY